MLRSRRAALWLGLVLLGAGCLLLRHLGHSALTYWDEAFHAVVGRNLAKHPLLPTLYDQAWLPHDDADWEIARVWLWKPPLALWQIALSFSALGVTTFALRLPSLLLALGAAWLTYRIGAALFDRRAGLVAAFLQATNPFVVSLVHGYRFADAVDVALLFWVELSCWLLLRAIRTGRPSAWVAAGVAEGLAFLAKLHLAGITLGIALAVWACARWCRVDLEGGRIRPREIGLQLLAALATALPWSLYCLVRYPRAYVSINLDILGHLDRDVEGWGAPWDRHLFDSMAFLYPILYVAVLLCALALLGAGLRHRRLGETFVLAWAAGVVVPLSLAVSKTPSATLIAMPPLLLCVGAVVSRGWERGGWRYAALWLATTVALVAVPGGHTLSAAYEPLPATMAARLAPYLAINRWILEQAAVGLLGFAVLAAAGWWLRRQRSAPRLWPLGWAGPAARLAALALSAWLAVGWVREAWAVTALDVEDPLYVALGARIRRELPANACLFLDDPVAGNHLTLMLWSDRSTYPVFDSDMPAPRPLERDAARARAAGARPYLVAVTGRTYPHPLAMEGTWRSPDGSEASYRVYELAPPARAAAGAPSRVL